MQSDRNRVRVYITGIWQYRKRTTNMSDYVPPSYLRVSLAAVINTLCGFSSFAGRVTEQKRSVNHLYQLLIRRRLCGVVPQRGILRTCITVCAADFPIKMLKQGHTKEPQARGACRQQPQSGMDRRLLGLLRQTRALEGTGLTLIN